MKFSWHGRVVGLLLRSANETFDVIPGKITPAPAHTTPQPRMCLSPRLPLSARTVSIMNYNDSADLIN